MIRSACCGNPWSIEKYLLHVSKIELPSVYTIGDYHEATGGIYNTVCLKVLAGELISGAIAGNTNNEKRSKDKLRSQHKKNWMKVTRTENTIYGSEGISAERRLTKRTKKEDMKEREQEMKTMMKNIQAGKEVMTQINQLKEAQNTLIQANVPVGNEYWEINDNVFQEKLKIYLKLWYFPLGGGKLSRTKQEQLDALKQFNITKDGIDRRILECQNRLNSWVQKYDKNADGLVTVNAD